MHLHSSRTNEAKAYFREISLRQTHKQSSTVTSGDNKPVTEKEFWQELK